CQIPSSEEYKPTSLHRADRQIRSVMAADVHEAVAKNLHARLTTTGITKKLNASSSVSGRAAVRNQRSVTRGRSVAELDATTFTAFLPRRAYEDAIACGRVVRKKGETWRTIVSVGTGLGKVPLPALEVSE